MTQPLASNHYPAANTNHPHNRDSLPSQRFLFSSSSSSSNDQDGSVTNSELRRQHILESMAKLEGQSPKVVSSSSFPGRHPTTQHNQNQGHPTSNSTHHHQHQHQHQQHQQPHSVIPVPHHQYTLLPQGQTAHQFLTPIPHYPVIPCVYYPPTNISTIPLQYQSMCQLQSQPKRDHSLPHSLRPFHPSPLLPSPQNKDYQQHAHSSQTNHSNRQQQRSISQVSGMDQIELNRSICALNIRKKPNYPRSTISHSTATNDLDRHNKNLLNASQKSHRSYHHHHHPLPAVPPLPSSHPAFQSPETSPDSSLRTLSSTQIIHDNNSIITPTKNRDHGNKISKHQCGRSLSSKTNNHHTKSLLLSPPQLIRDRDVKEKFGPVDNDDQELFDGGSKNISWFIMIRDHGHHLFSNKKSNRHNNNEHNNDNNNKDQDKPEQLGMKVRSVGRSRTTKNDSSSVKNVRSSNNHHNKLTKDELKLLEVLPPLPPLPPAPSIHNNNHLDSVSIINPVQSNLIIQNQTQSNKKNKNKKDSFAWFQY